MFEEMICPLCAECECTIEHRWLPGTNAPHKDVLRHVYVCPMCGDIALGEMEDE